MAYKFNPGFENLQEYKKLVKEIPLEELLERMENDYEKLNAQERMILEIKIKDKANDTEKVSLISIVASFGTTAISNAYKGAEMIGVVVLIFVYIWIANILVRNIRENRISKIYLDVINMVKENNKR